jgi:hypothetical protein
MAENEAAAARSCFETVEASARTAGAAARDAQERLALLEEKACQIEVIEVRALEARQLEARIQEMEAAAKTTQEKIQALEVRARDTEAAAETAWRQAKIADSARHSNAECLQQSMRQADPFGREMSLV